MRGSIELYRALMTDDQDRAVAAYEDWGFSGLSREMIAVLNRWAAFLYGPLMDDRPRRLTEGMADGHGREMASNVFGELRRMGGVRPFGRAAAATRGDRLDLRRDPRVDGGASRRRTGTGFARAANPRARPLP